MEKKEKVLEAGMKEGTEFIHDGMNYVVTRQYRKLEIEFEIEEQKTDDDGNPVMKDEKPVMIKKTKKEIKIQEELADLNIGECFNCGQDLNGRTNVFGRVDGKPVYIPCPKCGATNNYKARVYA